MFVMVAKRSPSQTPTIKTDIRMNDWICSSVGEPIISGSYSAWYQLHIVTGGMYGISEGEEEARI
jgi:hypothetical protein